MIEKHSPVHLIITLLLMAISLNSFTQKYNSPILRFDPPNWWTGMKETNLEILVSCPNIQQYEITLLNPTNCKIVSITAATNRDYYYVELEIGKNQKAGDLIFQLKGKKGQQHEYRYSILERIPSKNNRGLDASDLIYLVFPDRFSNGDQTNDSFVAMQEKTCDRSGLKARHGGDIKGIENHLDYFTELGVTALWLNPVLENDQDYESYHGYAATDLYRVDPRFGTNTSYRAFVENCHSKGIKVIWDVVYNHWGNQNYLYKNLPDSNWVHRFKEFTRTTYRAEVLLDPYASDYDKKLMTDAWFDKHMPDLNQQDPHLAKYLIQNSIWWIEYAGLDAFRIDTYAYPDQIFMKKLNEAILREYPDFFSFGETWVQGTPIQAWFTEEAYVKKDYTSSLQSVTDFQLYYAITNGLNEPFGWSEGFRRIELTLSQDVLYKRPTSLVTFLDNHDLSRFYSQIGEDYNKFKMGIAMMYTLRGIPSIYYGTEILMKNYADPDAKVREDFPGGWRGDKANKFIQTGRTELENDAFNFCKTLGQWRKQNAWIGEATLTQFVPENNTYVYFRRHNGKALMCMYNGNETEISIETDRFQECLNDRKISMNILTGEKIIIEKKINLPARSVTLLELQ